MTELTPRHVLVDLFGSGDFPAEVLDPVHAAEIVIQRLRDVALRSSRRMSVMGSRKGRLG